MTDIHQALRNRTAERWACPIACGECCSNPRLEFCQPVQANGMCIFHRRDRGCVLSAERRPSLCNFYLCERALERLGRKDRDRYELQRRKFMSDTLAEMFDHDPVAIDRLKQMLG